MEQKMIECVYCGRSFLEVCVKYVKEIWFEHEDYPFACQWCIGRYGKKEAPKVRASSIADTALSKQLQNNVNKCLKDNNAEEKKVTVKDVSKSQDVDYSSYG